MGYDVAAFHPDRPDEQGFAGQYLAAPDFTGATVQGRRKIGQRTAILLMSPKSEVVGLDGGTNFLTRLREGGVASETDVFAAFGLALGDLLSSLRAQETADDPPEERVTAVRPLLLRLAVASASLTIQVLTQAGLPVQETIPLNFILR